MASSTSVLIIASSESCLPWMAVWAFSLTFSFSCRIIPGFLFLFVLSLSYRPKDLRNICPPQSFCFQKTAEKPSKPKTPFDAWSGLNFLSAVAGLSCYTVNKRTKLTFRTDRV
ncbi:hypothetical protein BJX65DRAFT_164298 [Aspergillus insuetus]